MIVDCGLAVEWFVLFSVCGERSHDGVLDLKKGKAPKDAKKARLDTNQKSPLEPEDMF